MRLPTARGKAGTPRFEHFGAIAYYQWRVTTRSPETPPGPPPTQPAKTARKAGAAHPTTRGQCLLRRGGGAPAPTDTGPQPTEPATAAAARAGQQPPTGNPPAAPAPFGNQAYSLARYCACSRTKAGAEAHQDLRSLAQHRTQRQDHKRAHGRRATRAALQTYAQEAAPDSTPSQGPSGGSQ